MTEASSTILDGGLCVAAPAELGANPAQVKQVMIKTEELLSLILQISARTQFGSDRHQDYFILDFSRQKYFEYTPAVSNIQAHL